jgi:hypothetical protein
VAAPRVGRQGARPAPRPWPHLQEHPSLDLCACLLNTPAFLPPQVNTIKASECALFSGCKLADPAPICPYAYL